jgi:hypothetical protein
MSAPPTARQLAGQIVDACIVNVSDPEAMEAHSADTERVRMKVARKLDAIMKEATKDMESVNKMARLPIDRRFTVEELRKHFPELYLQQVQFLLKGYVKDGHASVPAGDKKDRVPLRLADYLSDPDSDDEEEDEEFKDTTDEVLDSLTEEETRLKTKRSFRRLLAATTDGKLYKAGELKIASVTLLIASPTKADFEYLLEYDDVDGHGGFIDLTDDLLKVILTKYKLDSKYDWGIHSREGCAMSPCAGFGAVTETQKHHEAIRVVRRVDYTLLEDWIQHFPSDSFVGPVSITVGDSVDALINSSAWQSPPDLFSPMGKAYPCPLKEE